MTHILIHPPFADPTQPYVSLPTLKGSLRSRGLDARVVDLNVEAAHYLLRPASIENLLRRLPRGAKGASRKPDRALRDVLDADPSPIAVFQDPDLFYDLARYETAQRHVDGFFEALSLLHAPFRYDFNHAAHTTKPWSFDLLRQYFSERQSPLDDFYRTVFSASAPGDDALASGAACIDPEEIELAGISVVFPSQIPEAFYLAQLLRSLAPRAFVTMGGPCLHQAAVHMDGARRARLLELADGVALFEGEETLAALLPRLAEWRVARDAGDSAAVARVLEDVPNLLHAVPGGGGTRLGPYHRVDLSDAPSLPDYTDLPLDRYLAPSRILLYAPTRGCYWNKCSFCYYGLSETATAKYREVPPERAASDLAKLAKRHGTRNFYLSCDVLSPSYAVRFARAVVDRGLRIRWSSDLKIERHYTDERCQLLYESGLRAAAFGIESGSDRILSLIRKGCDRATMTDVNRAFHRAGVATEWMTFTEHPTETEEEALATVEWIEDEQEMVDLFIVGIFGLEAGSHIATNPSLYGVERIEYDPLDDFRLYARFTQRVERHAAGDSAAARRASVDRAVHRVAGGYALAPYPWAGAVSTHHSFLRFLRFGQRALRRSVALR